jgi:hypothetical protein
MKNLCTVCRNTNRCCKNDMIRKYEFATDKCFVIDCDRYAAKVDKTIYAPRRNRNLESLVKACNDADCFVSVTQAHGWKEDMPKHP